MNRFFRLLFLFFIVPSTWVFSQENFPINGVSDVRADIYAFTHATIFINPTQKIENATLLIEKGKIIAVGEDVKIPLQAIVMDVKGDFIYPSFIDPYHMYGIEKKKKHPSNFWSSAEKIFPIREGAYNANDAVKADYNTSKHFKINKKEAKKLRDMGFGTVLTFREDGIFRGFSTLVSLIDHNENRSIIKSKVASMLSWDKGSSKQDYPVSMMGSVAVLRQTYYDEMWYDREGRKHFYDNTLEALHEQKTIPNIFEAKDNADIFRIHSVAREFSIPYIIKGSGKEYQRIEEVKKTKLPLILPLNFPPPPDVEDVFVNKHISLQSIKHWELAPTNPKRVAEKNIPFALTSTGTAKGAFLTNLRKAISYGLSEKKALEALTTNPAKMLKIGDRLGSLEAGKDAYFFISSGNVFHKKTVIYENWLLGERYIVSQRVPKDISGKYKLSLSTQEEYILNIIKGKKYQFEVKQNDTTQLKSKGSIDDNFLFKLSFEKDNTWIRLSGWGMDNGSIFKGIGELANGEEIHWQATYTGVLEEEEKKEEKKKLELGKVIYPFVAFGGETLPPSVDRVLIKNATVWTNEKQGIQTDTDVLIVKGKIAKIAKQISDTRALVIEGKDKHLTAGIIDEHSHIALKNINEINTISSQVRMEDVIDETDINIYRQLAGGVTTAQLLHGSSNPIGGQSAIIKMRWGKDGKGLLLEEATPFIKFALGENVKRSFNMFSIRYPQTRMGVEQVYIDAFTRAKEYEKKWDDYREKKTLTLPRKDIQLEALLEILNKKRFITCHSYVQSEVNMMMKVAEKFNFTINTFTHILEGYKVADKMKAHGVGGSTFSDWWAYKYEVIDAIPYNAALMTKMGVITAINSDDREMGRRLNQEAAKTIKYGGLSEEEALKLVTLNPAKLLHLDHRMGSIKVGKDADLVLWSDNPLSIYAKAEKTIIDGIIYFDREENQKRQEYIRKEKARLIQKISTKDKKPMPSPKKENK